METGKITETCIKEFVNRFWNTVLSGNDIENLISKDAVLICSCGFDIICGREKIIEKLNNKAEKIFFDENGKNKGLFVRINDINNTETLDGKIVFDLAGTVGNETKLYFYTMQMRADKDKYIQFLEKDEKNEACQEEAEYIENKISLKVNHVNFIRTSYDELDRGYAEECVSSDNNPKEDTGESIVLVAEDNDINSEMLKYMLERNGMIVHIAKNGKEAVDIFASSAPYTYKAILMDLYMPVMSGFDAAAKIRSSGREDAKVVKIIAMTASVFDSDIKYALEAGMDNFMSKPIDIKKIKNVIKDTMHS